MGDGPLFWMAVSGWLTFAGYWCWVHRDRLDDAVDWLCGDVTPPPSRHAGCRQRSHVRIVRDDTERAR